MQLKIEDDEIVKGVLDTFKNLSHEEQIRLIKGLEKVRMELLDNLEQGCPNSRVSRQTALTGESHASLPDSQDSLGRVLTLLPLRGGTRRTPGGRRPEHGGLTLE